MLRNFFLFHFIFIFNINISKKKIGTLFILASVFVAYKIFEYLPDKFDDNSIQSQKFTISEKIIDVHRQFIWGFSLSEIIEKPFTGHGPDSSNFIDGSQKNKSRAHWDYAIYSKSLLTIFLLSYY